MSDFKIKVNVELSDDLKDLIQKEVEKHLRESKLKFGDTSYVWFKKGDKIRFEKADDSMPIKLSNYEPKQQFLTDDEKFNQLEDKINRLQEQFNRLISNIQGIRGEI